MPATTERSTAARRSQCRRASGLGREDIGRITELIRGLAGERTILMVEHNLSVVAALSDRITVMARGRVLAEGSYAEVAALSLSRVFACMTLR